jgi:hypothetical protein
MYRVYLRQDADYRRLAQDVSGQDSLLCPACGAELMLELERNQERRGIWYHATVYCPSCSEEEA